MAFGDLQDDPSALQAGPAPAVAPVYPGECALDLTAAGVVVTSAFCTSPALALDGDLTTFAQFAAVAGVAAGAPIAALVVAGAGNPAANGTYVANGSVVNGQPVFQGTDGENLIRYEGNGVWSLTISDDPYYFGGSAQGPTTASGAWNNNGNPGTGAAPTVTATTVAGAPAVPGPATSPTARFLKVDWGGAGGVGDRFLTRIRLLIGGEGAGNGAIAFESTLGEIETGAETDVLATHLPLWVGDGSLDGTEVHELVFDVPPLARGLIFYPDYLLPIDDDSNSSAPLVNLYLLQVYRACEQGNTTMSVPVSKRVRVGVQQVKIYPWNDVTGPYDDTVASQLLGLDGLDVTKTVKMAKVTGGETVHQIAAFETERETKVKVTATVSDLNALHILLGGAFVIDPANGNGGEVQYFTENQTDRAPYFRLIAKSTNGDGADTFVFVKLKVEGNVSYSLQKDKATNIEFEAVCYYDTTYVRQDGQSGGIYEQLFGAKGETQMHS